MEICNSDTVRICVILNSAETVINLAMKEIK